MKDCHTMRTGKHERKHAYTRVEMRTEDANKKNASEEEVKKQVEGKVLRSMAARLLEVFGRRRQHQELVSIY